MKIWDILSLKDDEKNIALSYVTGKSINYLSLNADKSLTKEEECELLKIFKRLNENIPLQYAIGRWNFYGFDFLVDQRALIPRFETELLTQLVLFHLKKDDEILDIGTGSGAIALTIAKLREDVFIDAIDISNESITLAKENKKKLNVNNVDIFYSDVFSNITKKYNIIVSNPPYISEEDYKNLDEKLYYEPKMALTTKDSGLYIYNKIITESEKYLKDEALVFFEIGYNQREDIVKKLDEYHFEDINTVKDYNGFDRIVWARYRRKDV